MLKLNDASPYIVKLKGYKIKAEMKMKDGSVIKLDYVMIDELCPKGNLYHFWKSSGVLDEPLARHYFKQMIEGLEAIHNKGLAHRDIKLDNILLDKDFNVKISDFGYAGPIAGPNGDGLMNSVLGTKVYMAPEICIDKEIKDIKYKGEIADVFSIGVVIFNLVIGFSPFGEAKKNDNFYSMIYNKKWHDYWSAFQNRRSSNNIS